MRKVVLAIAILLGVYLIGRAVVEPFVIDTGDPASYRGDWGGPSLAGVLAVHCGPGLVAAALFTLAAVRRRSLSPVDGAGPTGAGPTGAGSTSAGASRRRPPGSRPE